MVASHLAGVRLGTFDQVSTEHVREPELEEHATTEVERRLGIVEVDQVLRDVAAELVVRELDRSHRRRVLGARRAAGARWCTAHEEARRGKTEPEHPRSTKMPSLREEKRGTPRHGLVFVAMRGCNLTRR